MKRQVPDRVFFQQQPQRQWRIRPPFTGELLELCVAVPAGAFAYVIIQQLAPGVRVRFAFVHPLRFPPAWRHDDVIIERLAALVRG